MGRRLMKTAQEIKRLTDWSGDARLYKLSEPIKYEELYDNEQKLTTYYVIISAVEVSFSGPETRIFPANENGETLNMIELPGSFQGSMDHEQALMNAGYREIGPIEVFDA